MVSRQLGKGVALHRTHALAVHQHVGDGIALVGGDGIDGVALVDILGLAGGGNGAVFTGGGGNGDHVGHALILGDELHVLRDGGGVPGPAGEGQVSARQRGLHGALAVGHILLQQGLVVDVLMDHLVEGGGGNGIAAPGGLALRGPLGRPGCVIVHGHIRHLADEHLGADVLRRIAQEVHLRQGLAVVEGAGVDGLNAAAQHHAGDGGAIVEGSLAQQGGGRQEHIGQSRAAVEGVGPHLLQSAGAGKERHAGAVLERSGVNELHGVAQVHPLQVLAVVEGLGLDLLHLVGIQITDSLAGEEGALGNGGDAVGHPVEVRRAAAGIVDEGVPGLVQQNAVRVLEVGVIRRHMDGRQAIVALEGAEVDALHRGGQGDLLQGVVVGNGQLLQGLHALRQDQLLQSGNGIDAVGGDLRNGGGDGVGHGGLALGIDGQTGHGLVVQHALMGGVGSVAGRHNELLQAPAEVEAHAVDALHAGAEGDGLHGLAAVEGAVAQGLDAVGQHHGRQTLAVIEREVVQGLHAAAQGQLRQGGEAVEAVLADGDHLVGDHQAGDLGAGVEGRVADGGQVLRQLDGGQILAVAEAPGLNGGDALGNGDGGQVGALHEHAVHHGGHAVGQVHMGQLGAVAEHAPAIGGGAGGQGQAGEAGAAAEGVGINGQHRVGDHQRGDLGAADEGAVADVLDAGLDGQAGDAGALIEGVGPDLPHAGGDGDGVDLGIAGEGGGADGLHVIPQVQLLQLGGLVEGVVADLLHAAAYGGLGQAGAVEEAVGPNLLETVAGLQLGDAGAPGEAVAAYGAQGIRQGQGRHLLAGVEGVVADGGQDLAPHRLGHAGAGVEGIFADGRYAVRQGHGGQGCRAVEGVAADGLRAVGNGKGGRAHTQRIGNQDLAVGSVQHTVHSAESIAVRRGVDALEAAAAGPRALADLRHGGGDGCGGQSGAVEERLHPDGGEPGRQVQGGQLGGIGKGIGLNDLHRIRQGHGLGDAEVHGVCADGLRARGHSVGGVGLGGGIGHQGLAVGGVQHAVDGLEGSVAVGHPQLRQSIAAGEGALTNGLDVLAHGDDLGQLLQLEGGVADGGDGIAHDLVGDHHVHAAAGILGDGDLAVVHGVIKVGLGDDLAGLGVDLYQGLVAAVVRHAQQNGIHAPDIEAERGGLAHLGLAEALGAQRLGEYGQIVGVVGLGIGQEAVILQLHGHGLAVGGGGQHLGHRVVDGHRELPVAVGVGLGGEAVVVQLRVNADDDGGPLLQVGSGGIRAVPGGNGTAGKGARREDGLVIAAVHGLGRIVHRLLEIGLAGIRVGDGIRQAPGTAQQGGVDQAHGVKIPVGAQGRQGVVHAVIRQAGHIGVGAEGIEAGGAADHAAAVVGILAAPVGLAVELVPVIAVVHDGGLVPIAEEGQERQGQVHALIALGGGLLGQLHIALDVDAVFKLALQLRLDGVGQGHGNGDRSLAAGGDRHHVSVIVAGPGDAAGDVPGRLGGEIHVLPGIGAAILTVFRENGGLDGVAQLLVGGVHHVEGHGVHAALLRIVAQLQLGTGIVRHLEVSVGGHGGVDIHHARALLPGRGQGAVGILGGMRGAHHQGIGPVHGCRAGKAGSLAQILQHQGRRARHMGRGHGGTAHQAIGVVVGGGIDIPAGGHDVRHQLQVRRGAPGGEVGGLPAGGGNGLIRIGVDGQGALAVLSHVDHSLSVGLVDEDGGDGIAVDAHVDEPGFVVVHDAAGGVLFLGHGVLLGKGGIAAGHQDDLSGHIQALIVRILAHAGDHHIGQGLAAQLGDELLAGGGAGGGIGEGDLPVPHLEIIAADLDVVHTGHSQSLAIAGRGANDAVVGIGGQALVRLPHVLIGGGVLIACGSGHHDARLLQVGIDIHGGQHVRAAGKARRRAQAQVHGVHAQLHAVLQSGQDIILRRAGGIVAEHLHHHQLRLGRYAGDGAVGGSSGDGTGHMGAVVGAAVVVYVGVVIRIVEHEGQLGAGIHAGGGDAVAALLGIERGRGQDGVDLLLGQRRGLGRHGKGVVVHVDAGIQHRHHHAAAVKARVPHGGRADHVVAGGHLGGGGQLVRLGHIGVLYAVQCPDPIQTAILALDGQAVDQQGVVILHRHRIAAADLLLDGRDLGEHLLMLLLSGLLHAQALGGQGPVGKGGPVFHQGRILQLHDHVDPVLGLILLRSDGLEPGGIVAPQQNIAAVGICPVFSGRHRVCGRGVRCSPASGGPGVDHGPLQKRKHQRQRQQHRDAAVSDRPVFHGGSSLLHDASARSRPRLYLNFTHFLQTFRIGETDIRLTTNIRDCRPFVNRNFA